MLGRHPHHWECAQQGWILSLALSEQISSSQGWAASLIAKTWLTSWGMWEQQNCILSSIYLTMTEMMTVPWLALLGVPYGIACQDVGSEKKLCLYVPGRDC
jgi:hypothetical protein